MSALLKSVSSPFRGVKSLGKYLVALANDREIRNKILFTLFVLFIYRMLAAIPLPGIDMQVYQDLLGNETTSQASLFFTTFTGGALETPSVVGLGIGVYITSSIIIQLLGSVIPQLEELTKEGQQGRKRLDQITRYLTLPLSFAYSVGYLLILANTSGTSDLIYRNSTGDLSPSNIVFMAVILTAGAMIIMWLAELITERGLGNGASIMITVSILSSLPTTIGVDLSSVVLTGTAEEILQSLVPVLSILLGFLFIFAAVVFVNESIRKVPIQYARRQREGGVQESHLPLKLNQTGVMPIIFSSALMTFPTIIGSLLVTVQPSITGDSPIATFLTGLDADSLASGSYTGTAAYNVVFFLLTFIFTIFYIFVAFKPEDVAENLQKSGAFIAKPAIRPGKETEKYLTGVLIRLATAGGVFLGLLALVPILAGSIVFNITGQNYLIFSAIGGTSILIVVSVALDTLRQIEGLRTNLNYDKYVY